MPTGSLSSGVMPSSRAATAPRGDWGRERASPCTIVARVKSPPLSSIPGHCLRSYAPAATAKRLTIDTGSPRGKRRSTCCAASRRPDLPRSATGASCVDRREACDELKSELMIKLKILGQKNKKKKKKKTGGKKKKKKKKKKS